VTNSPESRTNLAQVFSDLACTPALRDKEFGGALTI